VGPATDSFAVALAGSGSGVQTPFHTKAGSGSRAGTRRGFAGCPSPAVTDSWKFQQTCTTKIIFLFSLPLEMPLSIAKKKYF